MKHLITKYDCFHVTEMLFLFCLQSSISAEHCVKSVRIRRFFWSVFSRLRTKYIRSEYGEMLCISLYSVQMQKNADQKKLPIWTLFTHWNCKFVNGSLIPAKSKVFAHHKSLYPGNEIPLMYFGYKFSGLIFLARSIS